MTTSMTTEIFLCANREILKSLIMEVVASNEFSGTTKKEIEICKFLLSVKVVWDNEIDDYWKDTCENLKEAAMQRDTSEETQLFFYKLQHAVDFDYLQEYVEKKIEDRDFIKTFWEYCEDAAIA